jgi:formylglycine-generating enzyme required for sulfatase activity
MLRIQRHALHLLLFFAVLAVIFTQAVMLHARGDKPTAGETKVGSRDGLTYVWIAPGTFQMGCSPGDNECSEWEKPAHAVKITQGFWIGQTLVTQAAYQRVKEVNPSNFKGDQRPVEEVTWKEASSYCSSVGMGLPTEAEWEYAARAGSTVSRYGDIDSIAWYYRNSGNAPLPDSEDMSHYIGRLKANGNSTHPVSQQQPNAWMLYDMLGNVWEWTDDWYENYHSSKSPERDPHGPKTGQQRVLRGGAWSDVAKGIRVSSRLFVDPGSSDHSYGFRCAGKSVH